MQYDKELYGLPDNAKNIQEQISILKREHQKLLQENQDLKKSLQNEQTLHNLLYKQWRDLNNQRVTELRLTKTGSVFEMMFRLTFKQVAMIILPILILAISYLIFNYKNSAVTPTIAINNATDNNTQLPGVASPGNSQAIKNVGTASGGNLQHGRAGKRSPDLSKPVEISSVLKVPAHNVPGDNNKIPLYKVKSKAYFYNNPDSNTRRNAFIVHWNNTYATLKPLDEKNGFIYVVFKNHLGQTSKGWLQKNDLYPADNE